MVEPQPPTRERFGAEAPDMVAEHLDALLGEQLLPVRTRQGGEDAPYLLAVDAAGLPVVVEVVPVLDEAAGTRALRHAGRAARMTNGEIAAAYHAGPERFAEHLARFRGQVPASALTPAQPRVGARLLLVCSEVTPAMQDVAEFLLQPGWQVEILQVGVLHDDEGRRIVDVSPLVRTGPGPRLESHHPTTPGRGTRASSGPPTRTPSLHRTPSSAPGPRTPRIVPPAFAGSVITHVPDGAETRELAKVPPVPYVDAAESPAHDERTWTPSSDLPPVPVPAPAVPSRALDTPPLAWAPSAGPAREPAPRPSAPSAAAPYAFTGVLAPGHESAPTPDPRLVRLAAEIGEPMPLAWVRQRRGTRFDAVLTVDGLIELPDGALHSDPDHAAAAASGAEGPVDGWAVWRLAGDGPTLAEALEL
ncbi:hypothetical protein GXB85_13120 [Cellulomonas sp. APG4]|uniref:restriction system modified-DNA reader domain-containing protein n=1 Tax=Cellulomonas sp. APG4 TaxID=1538656 RepID=UPI00137B91C1|nr:hypothetical protein [Cellulomonas sp. APG4]NCT91886.1 hypothetical protein [Cellulomonas sp. APG4]